MARILTEQDFKNRMQSIMEYTQAFAPTKLDEADPTPEQDPAMGDAMGDMPTGNDMSMGDAMGGNMGSAPDMQNPTMGDDGGQGVEGLNPQMDAAAEMPTDMSDENDDIEDMEDGDEVIDVDELTGYQKRTAKGVGQVSDEIKALKDLILQFQEKVEANNQGLSALQKEIEERVPSQEERLSLRKRQSSPFSDSIEDYWKNDAPSNYSIEDDNNGEDNPKYQITKSDIDGISDWNEIAKSFDDMSELNSLKNIFGF